MKTTAAGKFFPVERVSNWAKRGVQLCAVVSLCLGSKEHGAGPQRPAASHVAGLRCACDKEPPSLSCFPNRRAWAKSLSCQRPIKGERRFSGAYPFRPEFAAARSCSWAAAGQPFPTARFRTRNCRRKSPASERALVQTRQEILEVQRKVSAGMGAKEGGIFDAHLLVLEDRTLIDEVMRIIQRRKGQRRIRLPHRRRAIRRRRSRPSRTIICANAPPTCAMSPRAC